MFRFGLSLLAFLTSWLWAEVAMAAGGVEIINYL